MFIKRLKLVNFLGIYYGTGLKEIDITFDRSKKFNMIVGENGSGKTVILNSMTPFSSSLDNRKNLIIPEENGLKEITIVHNDNTYEIKHHYLKAGIKSYISKNGIELNANGLVRSFETIVQEELGFNSDYVRIGRIGSLMNNFIDLKAAERKKYISNILPNIDEFLEAFKEIHKKFLKLKNKISFVSDNITKLPEEEYLLKEISELETNINEKNTRIEELNAELNKNNGRIESINLEISDKNLDVAKKYTDAKEKLSLYSSKKENYLKTHKTLKKYETTKIIEENIERMDSKLNEISGNIFKLDTTIKNLKNSILKNKNDIAIKKDKVNNISKDDEIRLKKNLSEKQQLLMEQTTFIENNKNFKFTTEDYDSLISYKNSFEMVNSNINEFLSNFDVESLNKYFTKKMTESSIIESMNNYKEHIEDNKKKINTANSAILFLKDRLSVVKKLEKRPKECRIDSCPFIASAIKYSNKDTGKEIEERENLIKSLEEDTLKYEKNIEKYKMFLDADKEINRIFNLFEKSIKESDRNLLDCAPNFKYFKSLENFKTIFNLPKTEIRETLNIEELLEVLSNMNNIENTQKTINDITEKLKYITESSTLIEGISEEIEGKTTEINEWSENLKDYEEEFNNLLKDEKRYKKGSKILKDFLKVTKRSAKYRKFVKKYKSKYNKLKIKMDRIKIYTEENDTVLKEIESYKSKIPSLKESIMSKNSAFSKLQEYKSIKKELEDDYAKIKILDESLNPTKGIPVFFIENYLNETRKVANELLTLAYDGKFLINKLKIDDSEFKIPIISKDGFIKEDVTESSQGEIALTKLTLSFALIQQSKMPFNIIFLDEVDSTLDDNNRRFFIEILERQIEKMNVEQVFIITHNNFFDATDSNLILLRGANADIKNPDFINGKNVLLNLN